MSVFEALALLAGVAVASLTVLSAVATMVVPRGVPVRLSRTVFRGVLRVFRLRLRLRRSLTEEKREDVLAWYAPISLFALVLSWLLLLCLGFTLVFRGLGIPTWALAFETAGSSLFTLGFVSVQTVPRYVAAFTAAALGLLLVALLITYLPTIYGAFQRREALVTRAAMQAGAPPSGVVLLQRFHQISGFDALKEQVWQPWTAGFVEIEESHTSLASLPFFRSPRPDRHWLTSAGAVLDAAALKASTVEGAREPAAELCVRAGFLALRHIADFYGIPYDPDPRPGDPISVSRDEWEEARAALGEAGVPLKQDVEQAWLDFTGWRVNYDIVLITLAGLVMAPRAPWSSDRSPLRRHRPPVRGRNRGGTRQSGRGMAS